MGNLDTWDKEVRPGLGRIIECVERILYYANQIEHAVDVIKGMPPFETRAEAEIMRAVLLLGDLHRQLGEKRDGNAANAGKDK